MNRAVFVKVHTSANTPARGPQAQEKQEEEKIQVLRSLKRADFRGREDCWLSYLIPRSSNADALGFRLPDL